MATAPLAWLRSITSVSTVGYTRHWALWTVAATERGLVILESGGRRAAAGLPPSSVIPETMEDKMAGELQIYADGDRRGDGPFSYVGQVAALLGLEDSV
jgi:hypothetical protein